MKRLILVLLLVSLAFSVSAAPKVTSSSLLARVKTLEAPVKDYKADMVITDAEKKNVEGMGDGYGDILKLERAVITYKKPDKIRFDGYAKGIKVIYVQNGYYKLVLASMVRHKDNVKDSPGKRQDTLDLGFLSSRLWTDNNVSVLSVDGKGVAKLKFDPRFGGDDKRHDTVWVDTKTMRVLKREKYRGSGELRVRTVYSDFETLAGKLPIATKSSLYDKAGRELGTVEYKNIKSNVGVSDSVFSLSQR